MKKGISRKDFIKKAKDRNIKVHKNNIHKAKSIDRICGSIESKYPNNTEEILCR